VSADNIIYVKKEGHVWKVWETGFSDIDPQVPPTAKEFQTENLAVKYAESEDKDHFVEYGISVYDKDGMSIRDQNRELANEAMELM
jgi:hypothetical protein